MTVIISVQITFALINLIYIARVAQLVEQNIEAVFVVSSSLTAGSIIK